MVSVVTHPAAGGCSRASIVSRRHFTGWWEYLLDDAIFAAPPRYEHSGAALISKFALQKKSLRSELVNRP